MTPSQLDHLRRIDAHLASLLDIAKKRTPGRWQEDTAGVFVGGRDAPIVTSATIFYNRCFIASCSNNAEAGWESTRKMIEMLQFLSVRTCDEACPGGLPHSAEVWIESILEQFPLTSLTPSPI